MKILTFQKHFKFQSKEFGCLNLQKYYFSCLGSQIVHTGTLFISNRGFSL